MFRIQSSSRAASRLFVLAVLTGALLLVPTSASAQLRPGNGEVAFDFGVVEFDENVADDTGGRGSFRLGYVFAENFELEGQVAVYETDLEGAISIDDADLTLSTAMVNFIFNFRPAETIIPYILVGVGGAELNVEFRDGFEVEDDSFAVQAAIGSRFFFTDRFGIRVEAASLWEETFEDESTHLSASLGLTWSF